MVGAVPSDDKGAALDPASTLAAELVTERRLATLHVETDAVLALLMGGHARLGACSDLRLLPRVVLQDIAKAAYWPRFAPTFLAPDGPHRLGDDRREIGWSIERHYQGFVAVTVAEPILPRHGVVALEIAYTAIDDGAVFRVGAAALRMEELLHEDLDEAQSAPQTYAVLDGRHVPELDDAWRVMRRIAVRVEVDMVRGEARFAVDGVPVRRAASLGLDWRAGVRVSAEDHSDGAPLDGDTEWRATVRSVVPQLRYPAARPLDSTCAKPECFCRRRPPGLHGYPPPPGHHGL